MNSKLFTQLGQWIEEIILAYYNTKKFTVVHEFRINNRKMLNNILSNGFYLNLPNAELKTSEEKETKYSLEIKQTYLSLIKEEGSNKIIYIFAKYSFFFVLFSTIVFD